MTNDDVLFRMPENVKLSDLTNGLHEIRREIDDLWLMARDVCEPEGSRIWGGHENAINKSVFEVLQLVRMLENHVMDISIARSKAIGEELVAKAVAAQSDDRTQ